MSNATAPWPTVDYAELELRVITALVGKR